MNIKTNGKRIGAMLVTNDLLESVLTTLSQRNILAIDLETTSLSPLTGRLFAMAIATEVNEYYFDFQSELSYEALKNFEPLFSSETTVFCGHNLKFDLHFLRREGIEVKGIIYCSLVMARVHYNDHLSYSLDSCGERIGVLKSSAVKEYMDTHNCFDYTVIPGKKTRIKNYHFDQVPRDILMPYALQDARVAYSLYQTQNHQFDLWNKQGIKPISPVVELEQKTTKVILDMESHGILIDQAYCRAAVEHETARIHQARENFTLISGKPFTDSAKTFTPLFKQIGFDAGKTATGRDSFDSETLEGIDHPLAKSILMYRDAQKRLGTYFSSFLHYSQWDGRIHCNINQGGTVTSRFSSSQINTQNLSDENDSETDFPIRKAFIASPGYTLLSIDYRAFEYYLMLDYAKERLVIDQIISGVDIHQATANMMGIGRGFAKTLNFMLLYGGGVAKLCVALFAPIFSLPILQELARKYIWGSRVKDPLILVGLNESHIAHDLIELRKAYDLIQKYFEKMPNVKEFIDGVEYTAKTRGYIFNLHGRRYHFPDPKWAYKAPNYLIQGGCADIMRVGLCNIHELLKDKKSRLLLQIHDEVIIELHETEIDLIPEIKKCLINAYTPKYLPMDCSVHVGKTLHDLEEWNHGQTTGSEI